MTHIADNPPARTLRTSLSPAQIKEQLAQANRRGALPEIEWPEQNKFKLTLPTHPMSCDLTFTLESNTTATTLRATTRLNYTWYWVAVIVNVVLIVFGPWSTELFFSLYSWYWQPPLYLLAALWIALTWPRKAQRDTANLIDHWVNLVAHRVDAHPVPAAAA